jgi:hypothetical protein
MNALLAAGLLSFFTSKSAPPTYQAPDWAEARSKPIIVAKAGTHDFKSKEHVFGKMPKRVEEYGKPALHVRSDKTTVRNFSWRGSMEGVHVGSQPFSPDGMRQRHLPIRVTLEKLFCDDIGEDCVSIQPRAKVTIRDSQFRGNRDRTKGSGEAPGHDKIIQVDGAEVLIENCDFFNGVTPIRGKANSVIRVKNCRFVQCATCVSGDGLDNPRPENPYDFGRAGPCHIIVEDCICWNCGEVARAFPGCTIELRGLQLVRTLKVKNNSGGKIIHH